MNKFSSQVIIEFQNFLSIDNIDKLKSNFIKKVISPGEQPDKLDFNRGIVYYKDGNLNKMSSFNFENELRKNLYKKTNDLKIEIDNFYLKDGSRPNIKYWQYILESFKYIEEVNKAVFDLFPVCYRPKEEIEKYLIEKYNFNSISQFEDVSFFTLKPKYSLTDLKKVYNYITGELFLDDEIHSFEDFKSVFFDMQTRSTLVFNCSSSVIAVILDCMKVLFTDLTRKKIEESSRFLTKPGKTKESKVFKVENFNKSIERSKKGKMNIKTTPIKKFFESNFLL